MDRSDSIAHQTSRKLDRAVLPVPRATDSVVPPRTTLEGVVLDALLFFFGLFELPGPLERNGQGLLELWRQPKMFGGVDVLARRPLGVHANQAGEELRAGGEEELELGQELFHLGKVDGLARGEDGALEELEEGDLIVVVEEFGQDLESCLLGNPLV